MARLVAPSAESDEARQDHGVQPFLVQLRNRDTGQVTEGLELGDVGPMPGCIQNDNGFVRFNKVRIPRTDMLMEFCSMDRSGTMTRLASPGAVYGTMLSSRTFITLGATFQLA